MVCNECGKEIPEGQKVCPGCNTKDEEFNADTPAAIIVSMLGAIVGALGFGIWGGVIGFLVCGGIFNMILKSKKPAKKEAAKSVTPVKVPHLNVEESLQKLKSLHEKGLITDEEYKEKRAALLNSI